jgi:hypothetical protein
MFYPFVLCITRIHKIERRTSVKFDRTVLLIIFGAAVILRGQSNLLVNSGMEAWSGDQPASWSKESGCLAQIENAMTYTGGASARLEKTGSSNRGLYQDVPVNPGDHCLFRAWVLNSSDAATIRLTVAWYQGGTYLNQYTQSGSSAGIGSWQSLSISEAEVPPDADMARCRIRVYGDASIPCYADETLFSIETSLSVMLGDFWVTACPEYHLIEWRTESENETAGFLIYRSFNEAGPYEPVTPVLIPGQGNQSDGHHYRYRAECPSRSPVWYRLDEVTSTGIRRILEISQVIDEKEPVPEKTQLIGNCPNPFNPDTEIRCRIAAADEGLVFLAIYDIFGRKVTTLCDKAVKAGIHVFQWAGINDRSDPVASGLYLCRLKTATMNLWMRLVKCK